MKKNKLFTSKMYSMQLGDEINEGYEFLTRVPGGWIYGIFQSDDTSTSTCTFIPFTKELPK